MWSSGVKERVASYISEHDLLHGDGHYLVAVSGGADSVALLLVLLELGFKVEAAHCNVHLRGAESDRDEQFVVQLCEAQGVTLHRAHFDTREYAQLHHVSIEMAARQLRYRYFEQLRQDLGLDGICVAHHRDDSVETVLMNLIRGTGIRGLQGIRPRNGCILRPLLALSRQDIETYLAGRQQPYVTDSTNLEDDVVRNKIRLNVIPQLLAVNASAVSNIQQTAAHVSSALAVYDEAISRQRQQAVISQTEHRLVVDAKEITSEPLLYEILKDYGFNARQVEDIYRHLSGTAAVGKCYEAADFLLVVDRGQLIVGRKEQPLRQLRIPEEGTYVVSDGLKLSVRTFERPQDFVPSKEKDCAHLDASRVRFPLLLRPVMKGDWFIPFGMKGRKLINDYLMEHKVNLLNKKTSLVVCDATGDVIWLAAHRTDNRFRVSDTTEKILRLKIED